MNRKTLQSRIGALLFAGALSACSDGVTLTPKNSFNEADGIPIAALEAVEQSAQLDDASALNGQTNSESIANQSTQPPSDNPAIDSGVAPVTISALNQEIALESTLTPQTESQGLSESGQIAAQPVPEQNFNSEPNQTNASEPSQTAPAESDESLEAGPEQNAEAEPVLDTEAAPVQNISVEPEQTVASEPLPAAASQLAPSPPISASLPTLNASIGANAGSYYKPPVLVSWQLQLQGVLNTSHDAELFVVDLFDTSVDDISGMQSGGKRVICHVSAGTSEDWRPDAGKFQASDLGTNVVGSQGERWLDIRSRNVQDIVSQRFELARAKGCDGVVPDNVDGYSKRTGFDLTTADLLLFSQLLSDIASGLGLTIGLKNNVAQAAELEPFFDFTINESCDLFKTCGQLEVFIARGKPVLHVEYRTGLLDNIRVFTDFCQPFNSQQFSTLVLPRNLDDEFRLSCF